MLHASAEVAGAQAEVDGVGEIPSPGRRSVHPKSLKMFCGHPGRPEATAQGAAPHPGTSKRPQSISGTGRWGSKK